MSIYKREKSISVMEQVKKKHLEEGSTCGAASEPVRQEHQMLVRVSWEESSGMSTGLRLRLWVQSHSSLIWLWLFFRILHPDWLLSGLPGPAARTCLSSLEAGSSSLFHRKSKWAAFPAIRASTLNERICWMLVSFFSAAIVRLIRIP